MTRGMLIAAAAGLLAACGAPRRAGGPAQTERPAGPGAASVFEKRTFRLVKTPDPELELALEGLLTASYDEAVKKNSGDRPMEVGFTYSLAPKGAVYPFSEIEVSCIMQDKYYRRSGPALCADFFGALDARIKKALAGRQ